MGKKSKLLKTLLVAGALIPTAMGLTACGGGGGNGEKTSCGEGKHTFVYYAPNDREQMVSDAEKNGITKKNGEPFTVYVMSEKLNIPLLMYDSEYDSKGDIYYQSKHYAMCSTCGEIEMEEHEFTASSDGVTDTSHNVTCKDCNYTHEDSCNFKGTNQSEPDAGDGECFCGKTAPVFVAEARTADTVRLVVQESASGDVVIPSTYGGKTVTEVAFGQIQGESYAVYNYTYNNITSITIPASVTKVYGWDYSTSNSFQSNLFPNLVTLNIEGAINGGSTYNGRFFMGNISSKLETVNAPNCYMSVSASRVVTIKGGRADAETVNVSDIENFSSSYIGTLNIAESVTTIPEGFAYDFSVETVNAPGVVTLEASAFSDKGSLETFNAPNLEYIGENAFYDCMNLVNIDLTNVKYIGESAFEDCVKINNLEIDTEGTVEIEYRAFGTSALFEKFSIKATTINLNDHYLYAKKVELFADTINLNSSLGCEETEEITLDGNLINFCEYGSIGTNLTEKFTTLNYNVAYAGEGIMDAYYPSPADASVTYNIGPKVITLPKLDDGESWPPFIPFREIVFDADCHVETISSYAFAGVAIRELTLPDSVQEVEPCAFYASTLERLHHSDELELMHSAVYGCANYVYTEEDGLLYFEDHTVVGTTSDANGTLTIKNGTKYIDTIVTSGWGGPSHASFFNQYIEGSGSITLIMPDTITEIIVGEGCNIFNSDDLGHVTLSNGLKALPDGLFSGCWALTEVSIPQGVESIGEEAFRETGITTISIPSTVKTIGENAFNNCTKLETVTFTNGLETIGKDAFVGTKISTLNFPASLRVIKDGAFSEIDELTTVSFNEGLQTIETNAFKGCSGLGDIVLPSTLTTLGSHAFWVSGITSVNILGSIEAIEQSTFANCENLVSVTLPNTLKTIEYGAFADNPKLQSITLPSSVITVASYAFGSCDILETINVLGDLVLNENVTTSSPMYKGQIFNNGYYKGTTLNGIVDKSVTFFYVKEGTVEIASGVFTNNTTLKAVYIPDSVTTITNGEFGGTNLTLAFADVPNPYKLSQMGATKYVTVDVNATQDGWIYTVPDSSGLTQIAGYYGTETEITIPTNLGGATMVTVSGFEGNTTITRVTMGDNVVVISEDAFKNCTSLVEVTISSTVYMIGANAFSGCTALTTVNVTGANFDIYDSAYEVEDGSATDNVAVTDSDFLTKLKSTYATKLWFRLPLV